MQGLDMMEAWNKYTKLTRQTKMVDVMKLFDESHLEIIFTAEELPIYNDIIPQVNSRSIGDGKNFMFVHLFKLLQQVRWGVDSDFDSWFDTKLFFVVEKLIELFWRATLQGPNPKQEYRSMLDFALDELAQSTRGSEIPMSQTHLKKFKAFLMMIIDIINYNYSNVMGIDLTEDTAQIVNVAVQVMKGGEENG